MTWHRACACCFQEPEEACCFPSGQCSDLLPEDCVAFGGIPQGAGTQCSDPDVDCAPAGQCLQDCIDFGDCLSSYSVNVDGLAWRQMVGAAGPFYREITPQASVVVTENTACTYNGFPAAAVPGLTLTNAQSCNVVPQMSFDMQWGNTTLDCGLQTPIGFVGTWVVTIFFGLLGGVLQFFFIRASDASCAPGNYTFVGAQSAGGGASFIEICDEGTVSVS